MNVFCKLRKIVKHSFNNLIVFKYYSYTLQILLFTIH